MISALDKKSSLLAFLLGLVAIGGAWGSQLIGGLVPCELCLEQRIAYYVGLPVLAVVLAAWNRLPLGVWYALMAVVIAAFAWGTYVAGYHAGVEYGFWPGPTACTGTGVSMSFNDLQNIDAARVVPCDKVQFEIGGVSMAGMNMLAQLAIIGLLLVAVLDQVTRSRRGAVAA